MCYKIIISTNSYINRIGIGLVCFLLVSLTSCSSTTPKPVLPPKPVVKKQIRQLDCHMHIHTSSMQKDVDCSILFTQDNRIFFSIRHFLTGELFSVLRDKNQVRYWKHLTQTTCLVDQAETDPANAPLYAYTLYLWDKVMWQAILEQDISTLQKYNWELVSQEDAPSLRYNIDENTSILLNYAAAKQSKDQFLSKGFTLLIDEGKERITMDNLVFSKNIMNLEQFLHLSREYKERCP